jgi:hypothetical protein
VYRKYEGLLCDRGCGGGRPHIIFHEESKKYILWTDSGLPGYQVSISSSPSSNFVRTPQRAALDPQHGLLKPADFAIEVISKPIGDFFGLDFLTMCSDKTGYAVYSILDFRYANAGSIWPPINQSMYISELSDAYVSLLDSMILI